MGMMMRRRRRRRVVAAGAIAGGAAYHYGKKSGRNQANEQADDVPVGTAYAPPPSQAPPAEESTIDQLNELAGLHDSGSLTDAEFASAKQQLLGG